MEAETQAFNEKISRQRLSHIELADGKTVRAILTVTLPGGREYVYSVDTTAAEAAEQARVEGDFDGDAVEGIFGDIGKALGKVAKGAVHAIKSVASSKVFKLAAKGLAAIAPALGPLAPVALTASAGMSVTSSLVGARHAASRGNKKAAAKLTAQAVQLAKAHAPNQSAALLKIAADKSRNVDALSARVLPLKSSAPKPPAAAKPRSSSSSSTKPKALTPGGALTPAALIAAARSGRVFLLQAG